MEPVSMGKVLEDDQIVGREMGEILQTSKRDSGRAGLQWGRQSRKREFFWTFVLFLTCLVIVCVLDNFFRTPEQGEWDTLFPRVMAVFVCYAGSLISILLNTASFERKNPLGSLMLGMTIRTTVVIGAIIVAAATKWSNHNLFSMTLVGCYFSFLALESSLSIKRIHSRI